MKKIIIFGTGILIGYIFFTLGVLFQLGVPNPQTTYLRDYVEYKIRLAKSIKSNKVIILGGSSSLFGIRADLITEKTGIPAVNMGVRASLGMSYPVRWARQIVHPGDVVLLAFEYELYDWIQSDWGLDNKNKKSVYYNSDFVDYVLSYGKNYFIAMTINEKMKVINNIDNRRFFKGLSLGLQKHFTPRLDYLDEIKRPININNFGDAVGATVANRPAFIDLDTPINTLQYGYSENPPGFAYLTEFIHWCRENHITVLATWPNLLSRPEYSRPVAQGAIRRIERFYQSMSIPILGSYQESLLPAEEFYDTVYHLVEKSACERTNRLLKYWPRITYN